MHTPIHPLLALDAPPKQGWDGENLIQTSRCSRHLTTLNKTLKTTYTKNVKPPAGEGPWSATKAQGHRRRSGPVTSPAGDKP
jgi:hypothetical protein